MQVYNLDEWKENHRYEIGDQRNERNTRHVILLTLVMMAAEVTAGFLYGSMALLADGWHMGTHAVALGITAFAYRYARRHADNPLYAFGTGKVGSLGGFTSAVMLAIVAFLMIVESVERLLSPAPIRFNQAILVAFIGLGVNLLSAFLLQHRPGHSHKDGQPAHHHEDQNLRAAYMHVVADALTSVLAIIALMAGKAFGWIWLDPVTGMVGAVIIGRWAYGLMRDTSRILLDRDVSMQTVSAICRTIEADADNRVVDIHIWRIGARQLSGIIALDTHHPRPPEHYKNLLTAFPEIVHLTIEVNRCASDDCQIHINTSVG